MNLNARIKELESNVLDTSKMKFGEAKIKLPENEETFCRHVMDFHYIEGDLTPEQMDMVHKAGGIMWFRGADIFCTILDCVLNPEGNEEVSMYIKLRLLTSTSKLMDDVHDFKKGMLEAAMSDAAEEIRESDEPEQVESAEVCKPMQEPKGPVIEFMPPPLSLPFIERFQSGEQAMCINQEPILSAQKARFLEDTRKQGTHAGADSFDSRML
jgi:hypothetical protein